MFFEAVNVGDLQDKVVDEWTYAELLDPVVYKSRMLGHWSTFVVRSHFEELVAAGISHVRSVVHDKKVSPTLFLQNPCWLLVLGRGGRRALPRPQHGRHQQ